MGSGNWYQPQNWSFARIPTTELANVGIDIVTASISDMALTRGAHLAGSETLANSTTEPNVPRELERCSGKGKGE